MLLKQGANLLVLQKYFDQWDYSLKQLGEKLLSIILNNWNAPKVSLILGEEPSPHFYSHIFARYQVIVEEGLNTATQKQQEFMQWMELNQALGGIIPPSQIAKRAVIQGKNELVELLASQEQSQAAQAEHTQLVAHSLEDAKIKELYAKAANQIAMAKERHSRSDSNVGLFEERLAEVAKNHALSTKAKMEALEKLVDVVAKYGEIETMLAASNLESYDAGQMQKENLEKSTAKQSSAGNEFVAKMMASMGGQAQGQ
jgi:hypothetical protein